MKECRVWKVVLGFLLEKVWRWILRIFT